MGWTLAAINISLTANAPAGPTVLPTLKLRRSSTNDDGVEPSNPIRHLVAND